VVGPTAPLSTTAGRHRGGILALRVIDVSMPLFEGMPSFPDDPSFVLEPLARLRRGEPYDLSRLVLGSHTGTHLDPPSHFFPGGVSVDRLDLEALLGPCLVVEGGSNLRTVEAAELANVPRGTRRVLLRTANSARWARKLEFFEDYVGLSLDGARRLVEQGVRLVGIDALSVETDPSLRFPVHRELLGHGVAILEGLLLGGVGPGDYDLSCLPLPVRDGDGGPARAVLRSK
jgi:arylformamidase